MLALKPLSPKNLTNNLRRLKDLLGELPMKELELTLQLILGHQSSYHHLFEFIKSLFVDFDQLLLGFKCRDNTFLKRKLVVT